MMNARCILGSLTVTLAFLTAACNPFAPELDTNLDAGASVLGDVRTVDGVFQNVKYAYAFRDTTIYGQLLSSDFTFIYRDYDRGVDVTWGRDDEMRVTYGLFRNVQRLDLVWNNIISLSTDSTDTRSVVNRNFNLTVTFNPSDIIRVDGYVNLVLVRQKPEDGWEILRWRDESNY